MTTALDILVNLIRNARPMTCPRCIWEQRVSFAWGNLQLSTNHKVPKAMVEEAAGPCPEHDCGLGCSA